MNRTDAKLIAEKITNEELAEMFANAKANITDWTKVSSVNKGMSKGAAWNILASDFDVEKTYNNLAKVAGSGGQLRTNWHVNNDLNPMVWYGPNNNNALYMEDDNPSESWISQWSGLAINNGLSVFIRKQIS